MGRTTVRQRTRHGYLSPAERTNSDDRRGERLHRTLAVEQKRNGGNSANLSQNRALRQISALHQAVPAARAIRGSPSTPSAPYFYCFRGSRDAEGTVAVTACTIASTKAAASTSAEPVTTWPSITTR